MPPTSVLTTRSSVTCADLAVVQTTSSAKLRVGVGVGPARVMAPVLLFGQIPTRDVQLCPVPDDPNTGITRCRKVVSVSKGAAAALTVRGEPVALGSLTGSTDGIAVAAPPQFRGLVVDAGQTRLRAG
jgi:hypothetical protein